MNIDLLLLLVFAIILVIIMYVNRSKVKIEKIAFPLIYILMYKTKLGLELMDKIAKKYPRIIKFFSFTGIIFGFLSMALILFLLTYEVWGFLFKGNLSPIAPLLPGIKTRPDIPILSFWHWVISIFILAGVHEFSHGLVSRLYNVKLKSSGFAILSVILPIIPAAFVEPDEKQLSKCTKKQQLGVLAAGSFSNYLTAILFFILFLFVLVPILSSTIESEGVVITGLSNDYPAKLSGMSVGEEVTYVNNIKINNVDDFFAALKDLKANDKVNLVTNVSSYNLIAAKAPKSFFDKIRFKKDRGYLGVIPNAVSSDYKEGFALIGGVLSWISLLFYWIFTINLAVGMFNMLPLGPVDGGRMFFLAGLFFLKNEERAKRLWIVVSLFCLSLIIVGLMPYLLKLTQFIFNPLLSLVLG